jgi:hypothetical protein
VGTEFTALPDALVQIQEAPGLAFEIRVSRKDPGAVLPRMDRVLVEPSSDGGITEGCCETTGADIGAEFRHAPARKWLTDATGKFAGQGFNLHHQFWGKKSGVGRGAGGLPDRPAVFRRIVFASG